MNSRIPWRTVLLLILIGSGCSIEKLANNAGKGLSTSLSPAIDSIARNLVNTVRTELTREPSRADLQHFIDSLLTPVFKGIRSTSGSVRDSFINPNTLIWVDSLLAAVTGVKLDHNLMALQTSFMGKTKQDVYEIERSLQLTVANIMAAALSDGNRVKIGLFRDELLGPKTSTAINTIIDTAVKHIVDTAVAHLAVRLRSDIDPVLQGNVSFVRRNAVLLLCLLAALAAIIIALIWFNRRKYLRMVSMLAKQIDSIPDRQVYDTVTAKIKNEAVTSGLEPTLREVLKDNGLLNTESWKKNFSGD